MRRTSLLELPSEVGEELPGYGSRQVLAEPPPDLGCHETPETCRVARRHSEPTAHFYATNTISAIGNKVSNYETHC